jgi:hypothetical protein
MNRFDGSMLVKHAFLGFIGPVQAGLNTEL